jgi:hypothetical protein
MTSQEPEILTRDSVTPMKAVAALYHEGQTELARAVASSLSRRIFDGTPPQPSGLMRRALARGVVRLLNRTTTEATRPGPDGEPVTYFHNRILENSQHPYAATMLEPSKADTAAFVEGGDAMSAIYMMLSPRIAAHASLWDKIILDSVQSRDVQWRLVWETRLTHELAVQRLRAGQPVRIKAVAAGSGLSLILVVERLLQEGHDPAMITALISDREAPNIERALRLAQKLPETSRHLALHAGASSGLFIRIEDALHPSTKDAHEASFDIVTVVGLLEYFPGHTFTTSEENLGEPPPQGPPWAIDVVRNVSALTAEGGHLIVNTYRLMAASRLLEVFGKRFRYRGSKEMRAMLAPAGFAPTGRLLAANIFDVEVFEKKTPAA